MAPRSVAPRCRPSERHLEWLVVLIQTPRHQDLWCRDVLPQHHNSWRRPPGSKDEFKSLGKLNINFLKKKSNYKKLLCWGRAKCLCVLVRDKDDPGLAWASRSTPLSRSPSPTPAAPPAPTSPTALVRPCPPPSPHSLFD